MKSVLFSRPTRRFFCATLLVSALTLRLLCGPEGFGAALWTYLSPPDAAGTEAVSAETEASAAPSGEPMAVPVFVPVSEAPPIRAPDFSLAEADAIEIQGNCSYSADRQALLLAPLPFALSEKSKVLILHTHTSEAYTPGPDASYAASGEFRTLDSSQNMLAVGEALKEALEARGVAAVQDRTVHDAPDYNASYANAKQTIERDLAASPEIALVIDLHRDARDEPVREAVTVDGFDCARLMFVVGTDEGGLYHPFWQENLSCALKLQALLEREAPGLCRPLNLRRERFNGQASPGALLIEVGSTGNTLEEALRSMPYLADAIAELMRKGGARSWAENS